VYPERDPDPEIEDSMAVGGQSRPVWHLRTMGDGDTHHGMYSIATRSVHAACGVESVPFHTLTGSPLDTNQVCPQCRHVKVAPGRTSR
jgi:hypothetical protein